MKRVMLCLAALLSAPVAQGAGYDLESFRLALIDDPVRVEFQAEPGKEKFRQAVQFIGASKGWSIANETDGRMELTRTVRGQHFVKVELTYDPRGYRVRYLESTNLLYENRKRFGASLRLIHKNYNGWIADLVSGISAGVGVPGKTIVGFAQFEDADAVPFLRERGREAYKEFVTMPVPRAFAIAPTGAFGRATQPAQVSYRSGIVDVIEVAMERCNSRASGACRLYALDNRVVWSESQEPASGK